LIAGWAWDGIAPQSSASGLSDDEGQARRSAEAWLAVNPGGTIRFGRARLSDINTTLSPFWGTVGDLEVARWRTCGGVGWEPVPLALAVSA
jgi:hypothetical protein